MSPLKKFSRIPLEYESATLRENSSWYIEYAYYTSDGKKHRVRNNINRLVNRLRTKSEKRKFALDLCANINHKLKMGWTPLLDQAVAISRLASTPWEDVFTSYERYLTSQDEAGYLRHSTALTYHSFLKIFNSYNADSNLTPIKFIYELNYDQCVAFLDWAMKYRKLSYDTRDSYRRWLNSFCTWCIENGYFKDNPCKDIKTISGAHHTLSQEKKKIKSFYIDKCTREKIFDYISEHNKHLLLAAYLCNMALIRPKEMMALQIKHFLVHDGLIFIPADISKNKTDAYITLPDEVLKLMLELNIFSNPDHYYLFNRQLVPAELEKPLRGDEIRDEWIKVRKALKLPDSLKFYNLKHTGITDMAEQMPERLVQQQARHHSIEMTERYVQPKAPQAVEQIKKFK